MNTIQDTQHTPHTISEQQTIVNDDIGSTREAYGRALAQLGAERSDIVVCDADLTTCTMSCYFEQAYPERLFNSGIAENNMVGMGAGLATCGKTVFVNTFAMFAAGRSYDQIRNSVCYPRLNVKVVGTHAGLSVGEDGATHQCIEDISLMRTIPNMTVVVPCDAHEAAEATKAIAAYEGPCYLRLGRSPLPVVTTRLQDYTFELGKAITMREGVNATIIATGLMVARALDAAQQLMAEGIDVRVINMHTIKPIDRDAIVQAAAETGLIITAEEHNIIGGLGAAVSEVVCSGGVTAAYGQAVPVIPVGVRDRFGHSGSAEDCLQEYGLTADAIVEAVHHGMHLKQSNTQSYELYVQGGDNQSN